MSQWQQRRTLTVSRDHMTLALCMAGVTAAFLCAEALIHTHHGHHAGRSGLLATSQFPHPPLPPWPATQGLYLAGYLLYFVPLALPEFRRVTSIARRSVLGFLLQLVIGGAASMLMPLCLQVSAMLFVALIVRHLGHRVGSLAVLGSGALMSWNSWQLGHHDLAGIGFGMGLGWLSYRFAFSTQLASLGTTFPRERFRHESYQLKNLWWRNHRTRWERMYASGYWDFLLSLKQRPRHYLIAGIVSDRFPNGARILDVGCGQGALFPLIERTVVSYAGVDLSSTAIAQCRAALGHDERCMFFVSAFEDFTPGNPVDVVVLNEILYYFPLGTTGAAFRKAFGFLKNDDSIVVVSLCRSMKARLVRHMLDRIARPDESIRVRNRLTGSHWTVNVYGKGSLLVGGPPKDRGRKVSEPMPADSAHTTDN